MAKMTFTRRNVMAMGAAGTLASACSNNEGRSGKRVAIVGAGIIGAATAYYLAEGGAKVTLLDRHEVATRSSRGTFAWLNATWAKQPQDYHTLNQLGMAGWQELQKELDIPIKWGGSIEWFPSQERQARLAIQIEEQIEWGEPARMVAVDELRRMEPNVEFGDLNMAAFSANDGALDPVLAARTLVKRAVQLGAELRTDCEVLERQKAGDGSTILKTSSGDLEVDSFVLATGADSIATQRLAGIDIPQRTTPGVIAVTSPMPKVLDRIIVAPGVHIHQRRDGRVVLGEQDGAPKNEAHAQRLSGRPNRFPSADFGDQHARRILDVAARFVPALAGAQFEDVFIGWRPLPLDGHPVLGFSPDTPSAYLAIAHSGVTLAPIIGKMAAQEILNGASVPALAPYRPDRNFEEVRRY